MNWSWFKKWPFWVVVVMALAVFGFYHYGKDIWDWATKLFNVENSATIAFTNVFGLVFGIGLAVAAYFLGAMEPAPIGGNQASHVETKNWRVGRNLFVTLVGAILGWAITIVYTPLGTADAESLNTIMQTLSVFLSGYVVSKLDRFLEGTLFDAGKPTVVWVPLGLFATGFVLSAIIVFVNRVYMNELNPLSLFTFSAPSGDTEIVAGRYQITIKAGKFQVNGEVLKTDDIKEGDFIKLNPRSREVEINGRSVGKVPTPKAPDAGDKSAKPK